MCQRDFPDLYPAGCEARVTITLPPALLALLAHAYRRRNAFRWALTGTSPHAAPLRELAAAHATGSRRLTPAAAYRLHPTSCSPPNERIAHRE